MAKNKQSTFADMIADSDPETSTVEIGDHFVTIQELSGRQRFELAEKESELNRWDLMLWICNLALVEPKPTDVAEMEKLRPEWVVKIGTAIMRLSGIEEDDADAKNESADGIDIGGS